MSILCMITVVWILFACSQNNTIGIVEEDFRLGIPGLVARKLKIRVSVGR